MLYYNNHFSADLLSSKIEKETESLAKKIQAFSTQFFEHVDTVFAKKFYAIVGILISSIMILYGGINYLQSKNINSTTLTFIVVIVGGELVGGIGGDPCR